MSSAFRSASDPQTSYVGPMLVALGAILFSTKAVVVRCAYPLGVDAVTLLTLRMAVAMPVFVLLAWRSQRQAPDRLAPMVLTHCCALGVIGYYLSSLLDFQGLTCIGVGLERIVLCLYPVLVVLGGCLLFKQRLNRLVVASLLACLLGIALTYAGLPIAGDHIWSGTVLVAGSAISYALFVLGSGHLLRTVGAMRFMAIAMTAACIAVISHYLLRELVTPAGRTAWSIFHLLPTTYGYGVVLALACTVAPSLLMAEGLKRVGAQRFVIISAVGPVVTVFLGWLVLNEHIGLLNAMGMALTVAASAATSLYKPATARTTLADAGQDAGKPNQPDLPD